MENPYSLVFGKRPANFIERDNEIGKGIIKTTGYGEISIVLPRFAEIAKEQLRIGMWL